MSLLDQLGGEKIPGAFDKNSPLGATVTGTIVKAEIVQMRDFVTGNPETWDDGNPKNQVRIVLDVNGDKQAVYIKAWGVGTQNLKDAVHAAGMTDLDVGATFTATFESVIPSDNPKFSDTKVFAYGLKPASATAGMFADTTTGEITQQQSATSVPVEAPAPQPATAPPAPASGPTVVEQIKQLHAMGLAADAIKAALGNNPAVNDQVIAAAIAA
ncbi:hypothetical protein [Cumulibacter soli]|uniref:hypothetical protein n=1 Tax=Cumulibacter soli TaxID=2546344 RepID=UPI00106798B6|nr:hypothetical protein [Cumulibacter soli]